jgi:hypothetical protein
VRNAIDLSDFGARASYGENVYVLNQTVSVSKVPYTIKIASNSTVSNFLFDTNNKQMSFTVGGPSGTMGFTELEVGTVLTGPYTVTIDGKQYTDYSLIQDKAANTTSISLSYSHSTHVITISGVQVVPEFPITIIPVAIAASVAGTVILRRLNILANA